MKTKIKIGPHKFEFNDDVKFDNNDYGSILYDKQKIYISERLTLSRKQETALHELVHGFISNSGVKLENDLNETICDLVASNLLAFMQDNRAFFLKYFFNL